MNRSGALLVGTAVNVVTLGVLLLATDIVLLGSLAGGLVAGFAVGELRGGAVVGGAAAVLAPPAGAAVAAALTAVALVVGLALGSQSAAYGLVGVAMGVFSLGPVLGLASLLVFAVSLLVLVPLGVLGGIAGGVAGRALPRRP
ncbi:hypothetical protein [Halosimplex halobium]|uniref:hypothetical protein n=1 Tax=Halosimplex halobium TaxID=3396618 RepID=UPI003F57246D